MNHYSRLHSTKSSDLNFPPLTKKHFPQFLPLQKVGQKVKKKRNKKKEREKGREKDGKKARKQGRKEGGKEGR